MLQGLNFALSAIWPSPKFFLAKCFLLNVTRLLWSKIMKFNQHHFEQNCTLLMQWAKVYNRLQVTPCSSSQMCIANIHWPVHTTWHVDMMSAQ